MRIMQDDNASLVPVSSEETPAFWERHRVAFYTLHDSWKFIKSQWLLAAIYALFSIPLSILGGLLTSALLWNALIIAIVLNGTALFFVVLYNFIRAPYKVLREKDQKIKELSQSQISLLPQQSLGNNSHQTKPKEEKQEKISADDSELNNEVEQHSLEEPTFTEDFDVVEVTIGENRAMYNIAQLEKMKYPFPVPGVPAVLYAEDGKPYLDVDIYNIPFKPPVRLKHNKLMNKPANWDKNSDKTALEIVDEEGKPVFQLFYKTPSHIVVNGFFTNGETIIIATEKEIILNPDDIQNYSIKPIFKYPSSKYPSERC